jgi:hypothetical protein
MKMTNMKRLCICAICIALCYVLPVAFHGIGLGSILSPMHIPVLLCGLVCGGGYGAVCGVVGPVLSSLLSGMPPVTALFSMIPELVFYGLVGGILMARVRTGKLLGDVYISLAGAMLFGRIAGGIAKAIFVTVMATGDAFTISMWVSSYFVSAVPGIVAHLVLIPILVMTLVKARVIPAWYRK